MAIAAPRKFAHASVQIPGFRVPSEAMSTYSAMFRGTGRLWCTTFPLVCRLFSSQTSGEMPISN